MAIIKKQYPTYTLLNNDIKGKVLLALPTSGQSNDTILRSQYSSAPIYVSTGLIVGMATGNYRLTGISHMQGWFIEVEQFLPSLDNNGIPYKSREIYVPFSAGFTPVGCEWHDLNSQALKGKIMLFSLGQIGDDRVGIYDLKVPVNGSYTEYNAYIAEYMYDHTPKSEYEKWLSFFGITRYDNESTIQLGSVPSITKHTPAAEGIDYWWDGTADGPMRAGYYRTKNAIEFYPNAWYDGIKPRRAYILASTSPEFDKDSPGVIFSATKEVEGDPFDIGRIRVYGLEAGQTYYFKTLIEGYPYSFGATHKDHGYDNAVTSFSYGDELALTMPQFDVDPMLVPLRIEDIGTNSIKVSVGFEYTGTIGPIAEAGICYIKDYYDRAPLITDGKATTPLRSELEIASINITGLDAGSKYRLRTYVKMGNGDVLYCDENDIYNAWTPATPVDGYIVWGGGLYETRRSFTRIPLEKIEGGVRKITATTTGSGKRLGAVTMAEPYALQKITSNGAIVSFKVLDYGEYSYAETAVGLCWTEAPDEYPDINDNVLIANPWDSANASNFNNYSDISVNVDELASNKKYFIRAFIQNPSGVSYAQFAKPLNTLMTNEEIYNLTGIKLSAPSISKVTINSAEISSSVEKHDGGVKAGILMKALSTPTSISDKVYEIDAAAVEMKYSATGLTPSTTYYVVPFVTTDGDIILGPPGTFKTGDTTTVSKPTVSLNGASAIGSTFMEISILDVSNGGAPVSEIGIVYSKSPISVTSHPNTYSKYTTKYLSSGNKYTYRLDGLDVNTIYYIAGYSINSAGFSYSSSIPVKTDLNIGAPIVSVSDVLNSSESHIAVSAIVTKTEYIGSLYVVYSLSPFATGSLNINSLPAGISKKPILNTGVDKWSMDKGAPYSKVVNIVGLTPGSTVYYAVFASNSVADVYSDVKSGSTVGISEIPTSIDCLYTAGPSTLTMAGTVSTSDSILKVGYLWSSGIFNSVSGLNREALSTMSGNRFSMQFVAPNAGTEYTVAAFVETKKGRFYAPIMNYLSEEAGSGNVIIDPDSPVVPNTGMFNPPSDPNQKRYSHIYDGVTRTWRRNSEGNWEREIVQQSAAPAILSSEPVIASSTMPSRASSIESENSTAIAPVYEDERYVHYSIFASINDSEIYMDPEPPYDSHAVFRIYLNEPPKFSYESTGDHLTELLEVDTTDGYGPFSEMGWLYDPSNNSIKYYVPNNELDRSMIDDMIEKVKNGVCRVKIEPANAGGYPVSVRPISDRMFYAKDVFIEGHHENLEDFFSNSVNYSVTLGANGIDGANLFNYLSPFTTVAAEYNNNSPFDAPSNLYMVKAPRHGAVIRVFGTLSVSGDLTIGDVYSIVFFGPNSLLSKELGDITISSTTEHFSFELGEDFHDLFVNKNGPIIIGVYQKTVTPGSESNGISVVATVHIQDR